MADDSAELVVNGNSRRVAMDITKMDTKPSAESSNSPESKTEIEGEVHDQEDLSGVTGATLKVDGTGEFKVDFYSPTRFRGTFVHPGSHESH